VYLYLPNISKDVRKYVREHKEELAGYPNLVMDLRGNYGGWLSDFRRIASLFVERGSLLGYERVRLPFWNETKKSRGSKFFEYDQIVVLHDAFTASAAESLMMALTGQVPNVTLLGENTFGKGIGQVTIPLTGGYAIRATVLLVEGPDGESAHITGITPHIAASDEDGWIEQALRLLAAH
jgi:C-terminal processing protease CtpA/Prc